MNVRINSASKSYKLDCKLKSDEQCETLNNRISQAVKIGRLQLERDPQKYLQTGRDQLLLNIRPS